MARSKSGAGGKPLALEMLEADHRKVEGLFAQYEDEKEGEESVKEELARRICGELTVHAQVEEEIFYPWLRENLDEEKMELIEEALVEHASAKDLIAQLEGASGIDEAYDAKVKVLSEYIKHHVKEEENEIFKEVRDLREELDAVGQEMAARKAELMEELGLEEGAEMPAPARGKSGQSEQRRSR